MRTGAITKTENLSFAELWTMLWNETEPIDLVATNDDWNESNRVIYVGIGRKTYTDEFWNSNSKEYSEQNGGNLFVQPYIIMKDELGNLQMGWTPSQQDLFSFNWRIIQ